MPDWRTMSALLAGVPDLPGARCKGKADLYERTVAVQRADGEPTRDELDTARAAALALCAECPSLVPCRAYVDGLRPSQRPHGVIAGRVVTSTGRVNQ
ncbi:hypothetical protein [Mycobacterium sp. IDR2000157661]|uniref:hypothetical protein n=1 Tax=Mycobacterium sp. IDR2000157661 TaxID=2867005 RepID=UPI001EEAE86C|nr:hypothetical protein [Mycobacterium sp. IDR2000157661]ULE32585.1 hypothetical protein K3G64_21210 [Mycobacterium sp. IDR2000157661]